MGNAFCTTKDISPEQLKEWNEYMCKLCKEKPPGVAYGGSHGGDIEIYGGLSSLEDYGNSVYSQAKEALIRSIAKDVAGVLKISSSFADKADLKDVISKFEKVVPNPRQGRKIKVSKAIHIDVCKKMAKAINKHYKSDMINIDDSAENICKSISSVLYSLFTGLHSEFLTVSSDISRIMRNLNALQEYVDGINRKLVNDLKDCSPGEASNIKDAYEALSREIKRQHVYLANLSSGVIGPTGESLINLVEETDEFSGMVKDLKSLTGSREFSDKLSHMMSGTSSVSHAAYLVNKALKKLGMSLSEYKNTKDMKDLRSKVYNNLVKQRPNSKEMHNLLIAADVLYRNDLAHDDIASYLSKKGGAVDGFISGGASGGLDTLYGEGLGFADMVEDSLYRDEESVFQGRTHANKASIGRQLRQKEKYRQRLFSSLNQQIRQCYNEIIMDLSKIGKKIGSEVKVSDHLRMFIRQLGYFSGVQPDRHNLYKALSGYRTDVRSEYVKHDFMTALESIKSCCVDMGGNMLFKNLEASLDKLIKVVENFNDTFTKTLTDVHIDRVSMKDGGITQKDKYDKERDNHQKVEELRELENSDDVDSKDYTKSSDDNIDFMHISESTGGSSIGSSLGSLSTMEGTFGGELGGAPDSDFKYLMTMKKAIREIEYYFKIANIKSNIRIASSQQKDYTKDYENILGEECGILIDKINTKFKWLTCESADGPNLTQTGITVSTSAPHPCVAYKLLNVGAHGKERWKAFTFVLEYIRSAKVEMLEAAQALDLYLSNFTEHLQNNPDDVKDFLKLLEQMEIVAKWFTDKSGDNLASVFESTEDGLFPIDGRGTAVFTSSDHYYKQLEDKTTQTAQTPGDFRNGIKIDTLERVKEFIIRLEKSFKSMRALENIISTFSKLNIKLGADIKSIMSPGLIFKAFMKYSVATSLAIGKGSLNFTAGTREQEVTNKLYYNDDFYNYIVPLNTEALVDLNLRLYLRPVQNLPIDGSARTGIYNDPLYIGNAHQLNDDSSSTYIQTDEIFEMCIKSMIAKVFTVVGTFSLFNRPAKDYQNNKAISSTPLRQILGGASGGKAYTKIIPEATELYIRLTLLGEWYRELFNFKQRDDAYTQANPIVISMIPAFDGIWSRFVKVIFVDASNIQDGGYTETFSQELVDSINEIYTHYKPKYGVDLCSKIMENFVAEVNMRYGLIKQDEINKYLKEKEKGLEDNAYSDEENVDYDILDTESQFGRKPVPSDRFRKSGYKSVKQAQLANKRFHREIINFRNAVEKKLTLRAGDDKFRPDRNQHNPNFSDGFGVLGIQYASVDDLIRQTTKRIKEANDDEKKYGIVQSVIMGVERYADVDYDVMLMFHETVVNPLTILYTVYKIMNHWNRFANSLNPGDSPIAVLTTFRDTCRGVLKSLPGHEKYRASIDTANFKHKYLYFDTTDYGIYVNPDGSVNYNTLMEQTLNNLFYLTCDKDPMVEMYFSGDGNKRYPMLSFKKLEEYTTNLVSCVGSALSKFRKVLPYSIVSRYEDNKQTDFKLAATSPEDPNVVSLFYIREHLINRLIKNKYGAGLPDSNIALKNIWLLLSNTNFTHYTTFAMMTYWNTGRAQAGDAIYLFPSRLIRDNWSNFPINKIGLHKMSTITGDSLQTMGKYVLDQASFKGPMNEAARDIDNSTVTGDATGKIPTNTIMGHNGIYDYDTSKSIYNASNNIKCSIGYLNGSDVLLNGAEGRLGLIFKFNRLLYHYVNMFTDKTSNKIYLPLLEKFANGVNANEIMRGMAIDDISTLPTQRKATKAAFPSYMIGTKSAIFATMAMAIRNIVTNKKSISAATILNFAEPNLLNVSDYMKDLMTAYLPIFEKHLNIICKKADLFKSLIEQTKISVRGPSIGTQANGGGLDQVLTDGVADVLKIVGPESEANGKSYLIDMLAHIHASARSLQKCVQNVYKELADIPLYFETYQNSITDYKNRNGVLPLMPLSHASHLLNNQIRLVPGHDTLQNMKPVYGGDISGGLAYYDVDDGNYYTDYSDTGYPSLRSAEEGMVSIMSNLHNRRKDLSEKEISDFLMTVERQQNRFYKKSWNSKTRAYNLDNHWTRIDINRVRNAQTLQDKRAALIDNLRRHPSLQHTQTRKHNSDSFLQTYNLNRDQRLQYYTYKGLIPHCDVGVGSDEFKFAYGTRGLLADGQNPDIELAPGVLGVLDTYNGKVGGAMSYDKKKMVDCFTYSTYLLRYAIDYIYHKTYLGDQDLDKLTGFYIVGSYITNDKSGVSHYNVNVLSHMSCQTGRHKYNHVGLTAAPAGGILASNDNFFINTTNITLLIENDNYKQSLYRMLRCILSSDLNEHMHFGSRADLQIYNILDANIVPINFHALQREIPMINLYNYSYTFDHMVKQFLGVTFDTRDVAYVKKSINTTFKAYTPDRYPADTLVRMLIDPCGFRSVNTYINNVWSLMAGNDGLTLNTPKYLSDQLWNKVLLNSLNTIEHNRPAAINRAQQSDRRTNANNASLTMSMGTSRGSINGNPLIGTGFRQTDILNFHNQITYQSNNPANSNKHTLTLKKVNIDNDMIAHWTQTGYFRYQTKAVRYIEWFVHLQRVMRLLMRDQLTWVNDPIVHNTNAISKNVTEFYSNDKFNIDDFQ